jgi:hypothetical protein
VDGSYSIFQFDPQEYVLDQDISSAVLFLLFYLLLELSLGSWDGFQQVSWSCGGARHVSEGRFFMLADGDGTANFRAT